MVTHNQNDSTHSQVLEATNTASEFSNKEMKEFFKDRQDLIDKLDQLILNKEKSIFNNEKTFFYKLLLSSSSGIDKVDGKAIEKERRLINNMLYTIHDHKFNNMILQVKWKIINNRHLTSEEKTTFEFLESLDDKVKNIESKLNELFDSIDLDNIRSNIRNDQDYRQDILRKMNDINILYKEISKHFEILNEEILYDAGIRDRYYKMARKTKHILRSMFTTEEERSRNDIRNE